MGECDFTLSDKPSMFHSLQRLFYPDSSEWLFSMAARSGRGDAHRAKPQLHGHITNLTSYLTVSLSIAAATRSVSCQNLLHLVSKLLRLIFL